MLRTQIYLPARQLKTLKKLAAEEKSTVSGLIREALDEKLEAKTPKNKEQNVGDWLLSLAEEAKRNKVKGPKDLAKNMDKYLYDKDFR